MLQYKMGMTETVSCQTNNIILSLELPHAASSKQLQPYQ